MTNPNDLSRDDVDMTPFEKGLHTALDVIASIGYGRTEDVDEGHAEAFIAVERYLLDWKKASSQHISAIPAAPDTPEVLALVEAARMAADDLDGYVGQSYGDYMRAAIAAWEASHDR